MARLDAVVLSIKVCKGQACRTPWSTILPDQGISTLAGAMDSKFDDFFANQTKVHFNECKQGHILSAEGPLEPKIYGGGGSSQDDYFDEEGNFVYERGYLVES